MGEPSREGSVLAGKYRLDAELGRGGMGAVYRAYHLRVHKEFAVKVLHASVREHRSIASRFFLEAQAAGRIGHPGILDVYDVGEDDGDGSPFLVMELLRGEPLSALVRRTRIDVDAACWIASEVLDVLHAAHEAGVIHRDVKPQNVFLTEGLPAKDRTRERRVKLLDFGIAKFQSEGSVLTRSGEIIGSPLYMSPEQARGEAELDPRADLWSVGAMLFEMLTGTCAHTASTPVAVLAKILTVPAPPPSTVNDEVPPEIDAIVGQALRIDREERFASAAAMRDAILDVRARRGTGSAVPRLPSARALEAAVSADATPIAISSTVTADRAPSPSRPQGRAATTPAPEVNTAAASVTPAASALATDAPRPSRSRLTGLILVVLGALVLVPWYVHFTSSRAPAPSPVASPSLPESSSAPASPASSVEAPSASASGSSPSTGPSPSSTPSSPSSSGSPSRGGLPATNAPAARPACAANEVVSRGHCCPRGLEWQGTRCERPLATEF
jgi:eukaryotic-like serine/threonine-protein kinase